MTAEPSHENQADLTADAACPQRDDFARLQLDFPGYRIWREAMGERVRLVAVAQVLGASPHTVVTGDAAELRSALAGAASGGRA